jgi:hypothetical protein
MIQCAPNLKILSIVVTGNTDLNLTAGTSVNVTSFDASAATGDITYTSANSTFAELSEGKQSIGKIMDYVVD